MKVNSSATANRIIIEGVLHRYELKTYKLFDYRSRITQYFKYQKYTGYISRACRALIKYGNYNGDYEINQYVNEEQTVSRKCAAYNEDDYQS